MSMLDTPVDVMTDGAPLERRPSTARRVGVLTVSRLVTADLIAVTAGAWVTDPLPSATFGAALVLLLLPSGLYRPRLTLSTLEDLPRLLAAALAALGVSSAIMLASSAGSAVGTHRAAGAVLLLAVLGRTVAYSGLRRTRVAGRLSQRTVVLGCGAAGARVVELLQARPEAGLHVVGFLDAQPLLASADRPAPLLGSLWDLPRLVATGEVDVVVVAYSEVPEEAVLDVLRSCHGGRVDVLCIPRFFEVRRSRHGDEHVGGMSLVRLRGPGSAAAVTWRLKRLFDVVVAGGLLLLAAPLMAIVGLAVRAETGPGVLFRQERVGMQGRRFDLLKFRSLKPASGFESATHWNIAADDRMGPVGRRIRRWSLDELPQLWNVLRGDMSLVGPRPERPHFVERFSLEHEEYVWRHRVPVGLTGWAQVNGLRGDTSIRDRARYDNAYIQDWSLWFDIKVLLRTARQLAQGA